MGSNHMNDRFRRMFKTEEQIIPTHDPQTGELNPYYEDLTGEKIQEAPINTYVESDMDKLNRFLINIANDEKIGIRHKILTIRKFLDVLGDKED